MPVKEITLTDNTTLEKKFTSYQALAIVLLALTQFTVVLDFMVMSPLGDMLMKSMSLTTKQFGFAVSGYAFSAGISGLLTAGFADRFDRKKLLLFFYVGFMAGTLSCGFSYQLSYAACCPYTHGFIRWCNWVYFAGNNGRSFSIASTWQGNGFYANGFWCKPGIRHSN
jgi:MFS family permease